MLRTMGSFDQLGVVLAHEMAHTVLGHGLEQYATSQLLDCVAIAALGLIWALLPSDGAALVASAVYDLCTRLLAQLPYSRKLELEADRVGLQLAAKVVR